MSPSHQHDDLSINWCGGTIHFCIHHRARPAENSEASRRSWRNSMRSCELFLYRSVARLPTPVTVCSHDRHTTSPWCQTRPGAQRHWSTGAAPATGRNDSDALLSVENTPPPVLRARSRRDETIMKRRVGGVRRICEFQGFLSTAWIEIREGVSFPLGTSGSCVEAQLAFLSPGIRNIQDHKRSKRPDVTCNETKAWNSAFRSMNRP